MIPLAEDLHGKPDKIDIMDNHFMQLLNSLSGIRTITNVGNQQIDKNSFIDLSMRTIIENLEVEEVFLYLLEDTSLNCVASLDWEQFMENESSLHDENTTYLLNESIIGKTATNKKVIHVQNVETSDEHLIRYESKEYNIGSIICAPILVSNAVYGVLELTHPDIEHFKAWQEHSIVIYADLIGMMLNNIQLITNMQSIVDARTEELRHSLEESERLRVRYEEMSVIDHLTKIYNRRYLFTEVASSLARAKRYTQPFSLLLMDLDHFKQVNDMFGHECGDKVLISVSNILSQFTREGDTLARIGGEEFVLALPETNSEGAIKLAKRIRKTIEDYSWECEEKPMDISISIGLASLEDCNDDEIHEDNIQISDILRKADLALYYVKQHGRNNVKSFSEIS